MFLVRVRKWHIVGERDDGELVLLCNSYRLVDPDDVSVSVWGPMWDEWCGHCNRLYQPSAPLDTA